MEVLHLRGRQILRPVPVPRPTRIPAPVPLIGLPASEEALSDTGSSDQPSLSPPRLGPASDFNNLEQLVDLEQLVTDVESGRFTTVSSSLSANAPDTTYPTPYTSPAWLPTFVQYILALHSSTGIPPPPHSLPAVTVPPETRDSCVLFRICTASISRLIVYLPNQLASLHLNIQPLTMSQVVQTLVDQDMTAGGFSLRALRAGHDGPPCMLAVPSDFNHNMLSHSEYQQSIPISESFLTGNRAQLALAPAVTSLSTVEFRAHHRLGPHVNLYEVHIVQPPFQSNNVIPFLESRYAYEHDLLGFLPLGGFGAAYVHYARYCILSRIAAETGLHINKPSQISNAGGIHLTYTALLEWAGVNAGSFANEKGLIIRCEQVRQQLSEQRTHTSSQSALRGHLTVLATEPTRSTGVHTAALMWSVADLRRRLPAQVAGPRNPLPRR